MSKTSFLPTCCGSCRKQWLRTGTGREARILEVLSRVVARTEGSQALVLSILAKNLHTEGVDVGTLTAGEPNFPDVIDYFGEIFRRKKMKSADDVATFLPDKKKIVVVAGSGFGSKNHGRISYSCAIAELGKAAVRLERGFDGPA